MGSLPKPCALLELCQQLQDNALILQQQLEKNDLPQPSFDADGPTTVLPPTAPQAALDARSLVAECAFKLFNLVTGPSELLPNITATYQTIFALRWLVHFQIFDKIPLDQAISYSEVASLAKVSESQLKSLARMAMTSNILQEPKPYHLAHTAASAMFVKNEHMMDWARFMFTASVPTASKLVEAAERWPGTDKKTETAYNIACNSELPFFDYLSQNPVLTAQFSGYMKSVGSGPGTALAHLVNGFDWGQLPSGSLVVDVGGSTGHGTLTLAEAFPNLRFEIQDLQLVTQRATGVIEEQPKQLKERICIRAHDFFEPQPVHGAAVYLLRMIIHDWADKEARQIISNVASAMSEESILLIMDTVLPDPGQVLATKERVLRSRDLTMMQTFNAKERSLDDWKSILKGDNYSLQLSNVNQPAGSHMNLLVVKK